MDTREKLNEFAELRGWNKNKPIGWSDAADFGDWLIKNHSIIDTRDSIEYTRGYKDGWRDASTAPDYYSFRCLIKFEELGIDGTNHISTGYWWHKDNCFTVDNVVMRNMTPKEFIPLYDDIV